MQGGDADDREHDEQKSAQQLHVVAEVGRTDQVPWPSAEPFGKRRGIAQVSQRADLGLIGRETLRRQIVDRVSKRRTELGCNIVTLGLGHSGNRGIHVSLGQRGHQDRFPSVVSSSSAPFKRAQSAANRSATSRPAAVVW